MQYQEAYPGIAAGGLLAIQQDYNDKGGIHCISIEGWSSLDLNETLEVSQTASAEVIEAA